MFRLFQKMIRDMINFKLQFFLIIFIMLLGIVQYGFYNKIESNIKILSVIFFLIAFSILHITMKNIVKSQNREITMLKAIGFKTSEILTHYAFYGLAVGFTSTVIGFLIGYSVLLLRGKELLNILIIMTLLIIISSLISMITCKREVASRSIEIFN